MTLSPAGGVVVAAGAAVTLLALVRLVVLGDAATEAADDGGPDGAEPDGAATARVDRIVAGILLGILGVLLIVLGLLLG